MTETPSLPEYTDIEQALQDAGANFDAAGVHGLLCGFICADPDNTHEAEWAKLVFGKNKDEKTLELLEALYETSYHSLSEFSFEFGLLLPEDSADINQRAELLGLWCQGFLVALEKCKVPLKNRPASDVTEALNDIIEIAQVSFGDITDTDEDETAYFELVEHVRLSVLMIFHEFRSSENTQPNEEDSLH